VTQYTKHSDVIFRELRSAILSGELEKGSLHSIYELADRYQVSRTPVREAVVRLADTGIVTIERNRGFRVRGLSAIEIQNVFEVRLLLEVPGAAQAAAVGDREYVAALEGYLAEMQEAVSRDDAEAFSAADYALHDRVLSAFGNPRLTEYMHTLRNFTKEMGAVTLGHTRTLRDVGLEHEPIVTAIKSGDSAASAKAMADHLVETASLLIARASGLGPEAADSSWAAPYLRQLNVAAPEA
jgi:DNA-binding GntR family transcriptional regulator